MSVTPHPECRSVSFSSDRASLGDPSLDERFSLSFQSTLTYDGDDGSRNSASAVEGSSAMKELLHDKEDVNGDLDMGIFASSRSSSVSEQDVADNTGGSSSLTNLAQTIDNGGQLEPRRRSAARGAHQAIASVSTSDAENLNSQGRTGHLQASVRLVANIRLGPPLNVVPGFLLSYTGGLVATALLQALMPTLLELLSRDYERWADGQARQSDGQSKALSDGNSSEVMVGF